MKLIERSFRLGIQGRFCAPSPKYVEECDRQFGDSLTTTITAANTMWGSQMAKRKRKIVPKHTVDISLHASDLAKAGAAVTFRVHSREGLLGTVEIGQGSFRWKGAK